METTPLSDADLDLLAAQVDRQLLSLRAQPEAATRGFESFSGKAPLPDAPDQRKILEEAAGEPFQNFWRKYLRNAQKELCTPGGVLYEQWKKYRDVESKSFVRASYFWLAAMGIPTASLAPAAVAASVFVLNAALKIGIDTICEDCAQEAEAADKAPEKAPEAKPKGTKRKTDR